MRCSGLSLTVVLRDMPMVQDVWSILATIRTLCACGAQYPRWRALVVDMLTVGAVGAAATSATVCWTSDPMLPVLNVVTMVVTMMVPVVVTMVVPVVVTMVVPVVVTAAECRQPAAQAHLPDTPCEDQDERDTPEHMGRDGVVRM